MILVMFMEKYLTIRSVFSKASDVPITIERLNASTYVYVTLKKYGTKSVPVWMFNFLSFNGRLIVHLFRYEIFDFFVIEPEKPASNNRTLSKCRRVASMCICLSYNCSLPPAFILT